MKIYIGADHGGFNLREHLITYLHDHNYEVEDEGDKELNQDDDYPQFAAKVATQVLASQDPDPRGILICKGAQGISMAANRFKGIRAAVAWDAHEAEMTRNDNDSNVLCLAARLYDNDPAMAEAVVDVWLSTPYSGAPRHTRRIQELDQLT